MSQPLAEAFFERDLSAAEWDALEASLDADPAVAERLLAGAEQHYRATGLPTPRWSERRGGRGKAWLWLAALALAGAGLAVLSRDEAMPVSVMAQDDQAFPMRSHAPIEAAALELVDRPEPEAGSAPATASRQGQNLGVVLRLKEPATLEVTVKDGGGRLCRRLFHGPVPAGERRFIWDGLDDGGRSLAPGRYEVRVKGPGVDLVRSLELRRGQGDKGDRS